MWRRVSAEGDEANAVLHRERSVIVFSSAGMHAQSFNAVDASSYWSHVAPGFALSPANAPSFDAARSPARDAEYAVISGSHILLRSTSDGSAKWHHSQSNASFVQIAPSGSSSVVAAGDLPSHGHLPVLVELSMHDGSILRYLEGTRECSSLPQLVATAASIELVCISSNYTHLNRIALNQRHDTALSAFVLPYSSVYNATYLRSIRTERHGYVTELLWLASGADKMLISTNTSNDALQVLHSCTGDCILSSDIDKAKQSPSRATVALVQTIHEAGSPSSPMQQVRILDGQGNTVHQEQFEGLSRERHGSLKRAFVREGSEAGPHFFIIVTHGGTVAGVYNGAVQWKRFEGLASVKSTIFTDLPRQSIGAQQNYGKGIADVLSDSITMVKRNANAIADAVMHSVAELSGTPTLHSWSQNSFKRSVAELRQDEWVYDTYGFRKLAIVLTRSNLLAAINTQSGSIAWTRYIHEGRGVQISRYGPPETTRTGELILLLVKAQLPNQHGNKTKAVILESSRGVAAQPTEEFNGELEHAIELNQQQQQRVRKNMLLVTTEGLAYPFPYNESNNADAHVNNGVYYYTIDRQRNAVDGHMLRGFANDQHKGYNSTLVWRIQPHVEEGKLATSAAKRRGDALGSAVRVTGDRAMLYRHTNPNIVFVATTSDSTVESRLFDAAAGRVLYRARHSNAHGPVCALMADNWVVYSYWDSKASECTISVLEMYDEGERKHQESRVVRAALRAARGLGVGEQDRLASSKEVTQLKVLGQSYFLPQCARAIGVTQTLRGITPRQVLVAQASDQIIAVDKKLLDPRRPTAKPTQTEKDEGLLQYTEHLPLSGKAFLAEGAPVRRVESIETGVTHVESTCLVLAHGLDILIDRIAPGNTYDLLGEDFSYGLLSITLFALISVTVGLVVASMRKDKQRRWS